MTIVNLSRTSICSPLMNSLFSVTTRFLMIVLLASVFLRSASPVAVDAPYRAIIELRQQIVKTRVNNLLLNDPPALPADILREMTLNTVVSFRKIIECFFYKKKTSV